MSNLRNALSSLSHPRGVAGPARVRAFDGTGAPSHAEGTNASSRAPRTLALATLASLCALAGALALSTAPALALESHVFSTSFAGSGANALSNPQGVAIDQSSGVVYVVDSANDRVEIFSASGTFISAFGGEGKGSGQFNDPTQVAVDNSGGLPGDVYVLDTGNERVEVFNAKGEYESQITAADLGEVTPPQYNGGSLDIQPNVLVGITVDASGNLWITNNDSERYNERGFTNNAGAMYEIPSGGILRFGFFIGDCRTGTVGSGLVVGSGGDFYIECGSAVIRIGPGGEELGGLQHGSARVTGVAVDPVSEDLYVNRGTSVARFLASGESFSDEFGSVGPDALVGGSGIAVMGSTGVVYVADSARNRVDMFNTTVEAGVTVEAATGVEKVTATLHGTVNPAGLALSACQFEYRSNAEESYALSVPCKPTAAEIGKGTSPVAVEARLSGLSVATAYHYRLVASDANDTNYGQEEEGSFTTGPPVEGLSTGPAEDVTDNAAKLTGSLEPDGTEAHYHFQYGTSSEYGSATQEVDAGTGGAKCLPPGGTECSAVAAEGVLSGLAPNTEYHYRLVGLDTFGTTYGADATFTTPGPPRVDGESAEVSPNTKGGQSEATLQAQISPDSRVGHETTYQFEYGETESYGTSVPVPAGDIGSGEIPVSVPAAVLTGLKIDTTYHYRVSATNEYATIDGPDQTFTTLAAALVEASASEVTATSATLGAQVNPLGTETTCASFQYVSAASFQSTGYAAATSVPCLPAALGSGESDVQVNPQHIDGLTPNTVYHYRLLATNTLGSVGPDLTFTTQGPAVSSLPDGRAWEMVSPAVKDGALIEPIDSGSGAGEAEVIQAAAGGERFSFLTDFPTESEPRGTGPGTQVLSTRTPGGWQSRDLALPHLRASAQSIAEGNEYRFFSEDLSLAVVQPFGAFDPALSGEASEQTAFQHTDYAGGEVCADGCYRPLVTGAAGFANVPAGTRFGLGNENGLVKPCPPVLICGPEFVGASGDAQHVVLEAEGGLVPPGGDLYEWDGATGRLAAVSVLPKTNGEGGGATFGTLGGTQNSDARNAISSDGSRVFFAAAGEGLYMREPYGGAGGTGVTLRLDLPQAGCPASVCKGTVHAVFQDASVDGSRVWFTDEQRLTANAGAKEHAPDLYECAITLQASGEPVCKLSDLGAAGGVVGASEDGSYLYVAGPAGVFLHHYDSEPGHEGWEAPRFIAPSADGLSIGELTKMMARVSPNGQWLAFMSDQSLTGYDNTDARGYEHEAEEPYGVVYKDGQPVPARDEEVYLYSAETGKLVCASCNPTGARPIGSEYGEGLPLVGGNRLWKSNTWLAALVPGWTPYRQGQARYQSRYLSNSGRLFFDSRDPLVPQAVNENWDVYEWEPHGVPSGSHSCSTATNGFVASSGGCVGLISSGESPDESAFLDASESGGEGPGGEQLQQGGGDVFFMTTTKLAPQDIDNSYDVYDAHECTTASPCLPAPPTTPPVCTSADQCRAAPTPEPALFSAPPSATFNGPGNLAPPAPVAVKKVTKKTVKCKKGDVKNKKGKCVPKKKKSKKAKKSAHKSNRRAR